MFKEESIHIFISLIFLLFGEKESKCPTSMNSMSNSSIESQKGGVQWCSIENQKGAVAVQNLCDR